MRSLTRECPVQVWPDNFVKGIRTLDGPHRDKHGEVFVPSLGNGTPLKQALEQEHPSDAHLTTYALFEEGGSFVQDIPLLTKYVLKEIQQEGGDIYTTAFGLDWDTEGHLPLTEPVFTKFMTDFSKATALDERLANWTCIYTTRHGCRVFYELEKPVPVEAGEQFATSLVKIFRQHGIHFDPSCRDWTRRFRLPKVVRNGIKTTEEPIFHIYFRDKKLDLSGFKRTDLRSLVIASTTDIPSNAPQQDVLHKLMYSEGTRGREVMSYFHKKAKALLKNYPYYAGLFDTGTPLCGNGGRNDFFKKMLGVLTPLLIEKADASIEQIYALIHDPICELEILPGKQSPEEFVWNMLQDFYKRDYERFLLKKQKKADSIEESQGSLEKMAAGMRKWCDAEELASDDNLDVESFVRNHIFANIGKYFYPLGEDGWYVDIWLTKEQLVPRIRKSFLNTIIETEKYNPQGELVSTSATEIANKYSTVVQEVRMTPLQGARGRIDDIDGDRPKLQLPMYQRNEFLVPEWHAAVDGWLRALFGDNYNRGIEWIANALAFERGPICALSLAGAGSVGKKLLVEGLAECLEEPYSGTGMDLAGGFNGILLKTPFIFVNEGFPKNQRGMSPSDFFKSCTAGDAIPVREMYKPAVNVINPLRIILTANDHDLLYELTRGKELTPDTKKAMGERILHFDITEDAANFLTRLGGRSFTEKEGQRWIRGDSGQDSDYIVAKHFLALYEHSCKTYTKHAGRYCVMGNCNEAESFQLASQSDLLAGVVKGVAGLFERPGSLKDHRFVTDTGRLFATMHGILTYMVEVQENRVSERNLERVLKSLMLRVEPFLKDGRTYYEFDVDSLLAVCIPWSVDCGVLRAAKELYIKSGGMGGIK